jgi:hypothetical protein
MFVCGHCGQYHVDDESAEACRKAQRATNRLMLLIATMIIVGVFGISATISQLVYGDWRCTFMQCRKIIVDK